MNISMHYFLLVIDNCESEPCMNNGNCTVKLNSYACECISGKWEGTRCENGKKRQLKYMFKEIVVFM